jgi:hypothetical protein
MPLTLTWTDGDTLAFLLRALKGWIAEVTFTDDHPRGRGPHLMQLEGERDGRLLAGRYDRENGPRGPLFVIELESIVNINIT